MLKDALNGWAVMIKNLRVNQNTDYGRYYHFDQIEKLADYQRLVPLTDYVNYKRLLDLQTNIGESGILTTEPTRHYFINGGSIVQDKKKPWEDIYECFKSAGLTIDKLTEVGVDANDIAQLFYSMLTQY